ncbi:uncharacterized protein BCR38DRAFT_502784 [Pseudomassariella vexata]|uniref:BTB domain-containing protein n=1 Tax=Pseudomassariella vexata TaxID=1141098 RepID=A0A1Y2EE87_9PEZI|nr:uncharacterized protein BCR38DRAFT_502784 [Pseudomassariella vexata]ORY69888.1 hypothetical protein BCR38DRAFT_502784 [Pseudomassariella vexata]
MSTAVSPSEADKQLLESGNFADTTVRLGDRVWKLHKSVLCTRSEWFKRALCGKFIEAEKNEVVLSKEEDPTTIDQMFYWMYARELMPCVFDDESQLYVACIKLYHAADYFMLEPLKVVVSNHLSARLRAKANAAQKQFCTPVTSNVATSPNFFNGPSAVGLFNVFNSPNVVNDPSTANNTNNTNNTNLTVDYKGFADGLELAFLNCRFDELFHKFFHFFEATHLWVLTDPNFKSVVLQRVPELAIDILEMVRDGVRGKTYHPDLLPPAKCRSCRRVPWSWDSFYWGEIRIKANGKLSASCCLCTPGKKI